MSAGGLTIQSLQQVPHLLSPAALAMADTAGKWQLAKHLDVLNEHLVREWLTPNGRLLVNLPFQHGKQIHEEELVPVPGRGWVFHGDLEAGDEVYAPDGSIVEVVAVGPKAEQDCAVEFTDGAVIRCHENHEWVVYDRGTRKWRVVETKYLETRKLRSGGHATLQVASSGPLAGVPWVGLPIDPYALGAWLGDGRAEAGQLCWGEDGKEVAEAVAACGYALTSTWVQAESGVHYGQFDGLKAALRRAEVFDNKHVPRRYMTAIEHQREQLLAGLIDTDGSYSSDSGQYRFTNTNQRLVADVVELARSLGFRVGKVQCYEPCRSSSGIEGKKEVQVVAFTASRVLPCRLPRKVPCKPGRVENRGIVSVHRVEKGVGNCIQVEGGQYLVGKNLVPTHNSWLCSHYFPAWVLLLWPETRIALASYEERYSESFGAKVKQVLQRFGPAHGVVLKRDAKAKGEWVIKGHEGGMVCKGRHGALTGRPADLLLMDDMVKDAEEASSVAVLDSLWDWYQTVAYSRLGPRAPVIAVGTRWGQRDLFGRILEESRHTQEAWRHVVFKAIAGKDDLLGRKEGEALWPERVPLARLEMIRSQRGRWFETCWQQAPVAEGGNLFHPWDWPTFEDLGDNYGLVDPGKNRKFLSKQEVMVLITVDWGTSENRKNDPTAMGVYGLTPAGQLLVLEVVKKHLALERCCPELAAVCRRWKPNLVAAEATSFQGALLMECRRFPDIPEVRRLETGTSANMKLKRATGAIVLGENGRIYLPRDGPPWLNDFQTELAAFTGEKDGVDDQTDTLSYAAYLAQTLRGSTATGCQHWPVGPFTAGKEPFYG